MNKNIQNVLLSELEQRKQKNPAYSLRAFARNLEISPAHLSLLIHGKRNLTRKQALRLALKLNLSSSERMEFFASAFPEFSSPKENLERDRRLLREDEFNLISDWYHLAILSLAALPRNRSHPKWIASQLGITEIDAVTAFNRLKRLGLIKDHRGGFRRNERPLTTFDIPSEARRRYHKQNLELAREKIDMVPLIEREFTSITMAIAPGNLELAKKRINEFKNQLSEELESGVPERVYTLAIQLFPVSK